jgi:predicted nucleotide-binding protein
MMQTIDSGRRNRKPPRAAARRNRKILLIHGHDDANVTRLLSLIRGFWRCTVETLSDLPAQGRTIIEKFEQVAEGAGFVVALLTPDDVVRSHGKRYQQARPNVMLELGWAYGRLGRSRVCLLSKKGTELPSDLHGINRIDFRENVLDVWLKLQLELESAGMLKKADRLSPHE